MPTATDIENKRIFTIVSSRPEVIKKCQGFLQTRIAQATVYVAADGADAIFKMDNVAPHVILIDYSLQKMPAFALVNEVLKSKKLKDSSIILLSSIPDNEHFVDEVVQCKVQFLTDIDDTEMFGRLVSRALNRITLQKDAAYKLRFLGQGEVLFKENEEASSTFFVKRGVLEARKLQEAEEVTLGTVKFGEFVGEMAHFNLAPRSATVVAKTDCELIEIPFEALEMVLFSKPAWSRALIATLTNRLKEANQKVGV